MQLRYHKGQNFGDALNPLIFNHFLEQYFTPGVYPETSFYGIGSILGDNFAVKNTKVVFSSGYAQGDVSTYGGAPVIDNSYDIICVRGPLTCKALDIDPKLAITDGAILLKAFDYKVPTKKYKYSYIPHVGSESYCDWRSLCEQEDFHFISPKNNVSDVINEMLSSEVIFTEAMHGAIVADALRIPWVPVKAYSTVNEFKWQDWSMSLDLNPVFTELSSVYSRDFIEKSLRSKFAKMPGFLIAPGAAGYHGIQSLFNEKKLARQLRQLKNHKMYLSSDKVSDEKYHALLEKIELFKRKYPLPG